jgi:hypothetical protein
MDPRVRETYVYMLHKGPMLRSVVNVDEVTYVGYKTKHFKQNDWIMHMTSVEFELHTLR